MHQLLLHGLIEKAKDRYTATCLELNIVTEGETVTEAKVNLKEAVKGFLKTVSSRGWQEELIPRPAPPRDWAKFFKAGAAEYRRKKIRTISPRNIQLEQAVYA